MNKLHRENVMIQLFLSLLPLFGIYKSKKYFMVIYGNETSFYKIVVGPIFDFIWRASLISLSISAKFSTHLMLVLHQFFAIEANGRNLNFYSESRNTTSEWDLNPRPAGENPRCYQLATGTNHACFSRK